MPRVPALVLAACCLALLLLGAAFAPERMSGGDLDAAWAGVLAVPPDAAQRVTDELARAGVRVVLNYTPVIVRVPEGVTLHNTDPVQELLHTLYYLSRRDGVARV